jgi:hypothetical protein
LYCIDELRANAEVLRLQATELGDHLFGQAIAEILLVRIARQILEREHGESEGGGLGGAAPKSVPDAAHIEADGRSSNEEQRGGGKSPLAAHHSIAPADPWRDGPGLNRCEGSAHFARVLKTLRRVLLEASPDHRPQLDRDATGQRHWCVS